MRNEMQRRVYGKEFRAAEADGKKYIEGYFVVFGDVYEMGPGMSESIDPRAFEGQLKGDVRALIDHESRLVLGRTIAGTLVLKVDEHGLWGRIEINESDLDAVNLWHRVQRGDVTQCSFGFEILDENREIDEATGAVHWIILRVKLWEVSVVTFPAYERTSVKARAAEMAEIKRRRVEAWRENWKRRLKL